LKKKKTKLITNLKIQDKFRKFFNNLKI